MTWVSWRLQRTETMIAFAILGLLAALLIPTGITMANAYHQDGLSSCLALNAGPTCAQRIGDFQARFQALNMLANWFTLIPGLIGVLLAAPFILDLEHGTYRLAWTQSITRGRWLLGKLALPILAAILAGGALIVLFTWWRAPQVNLNGRLDIGIYDTQGIVVVGYTLFALALALALGAVWRRSAVVAHRRIRRLLRHARLRRLLAPRPARITRDGNLERRSAAALPLSRVHHQRERHHQRPPHLHRGRPLGRALAARRPRPRRPAPPSTRSTSPPATSGALQLTETGLFAGLAALLILFAAWWTYERVA